MTLIAAFTVGGTPIVLGDMMLSTDERTATGLRKKVHRVAPNLALAWTGSLIAAESVIGAAHDYFQHVAPSVSGLEEFFKHTAPDLGAGILVEIIGWIIEGSNRCCFRWRSDWPHDVFYGRYQCGGSGEKLIEQAARVELAHPKSSAEWLTMFLMTRMMGDEGSDRSNWEKGFGFAYEAVLWQADEFRYMDNILYGFCDAPFGESGNFMGTDFVSTIVKYDCIQEHYALVQRQSIVVEGSAVRTHTHRHLICPVYQLPDRDKVVKQIASVDYPFGYDAKYTGLYAVIIKDADTPNRTVLPLPAVVVTSRAGAESGFAVSFSPDPNNPHVGTLQVRIPHWFFEVAYKAQVGSGASSPPAGNGNVNKGPA